MGVGYHRLVGSLDRRQAEANWSPSQISHLKKAGRRIDGPLNLRSEIFLLLKDLGVVGFDLLRFIAELRRFLVDRVDLRRQRVDLRL